jgi:hypothetical protein
MEEAGSFAYSLEVLEDLGKQIDAGIEALGGNPILERVLD